MNCRNFFLICRQFVEICFNVEKPVYLFKLKKKESSFLLSALGTFSTNYSACASAFLLMKTGKMGIEKLFQSLSLQIEKRKQLLIID